ncbi:unnamed protein product [Paramecium pentaurelia]|uniref:Uncharacterized protein n=1 Tax=Paramecium pentaurelia TaxID=43138 RepID=A0A8S1YL74_9CILI|nr:unnamed protein product [Paramecium pentaurelia]
MFLSGRADQFLMILLQLLEKGQQKQKLNGHSNCVLSVYLLHDVNTLASGDDEEHIRLWDIKTRQQKLRLDGHTSSVRPVYYFSGNKLSSVNWDNSIQLRNVNSGQQIQPLHNSFQDKLAYLKKAIFNFILLRNWLQILLQSFSQEYLIMGQTLEYMQLIFYMIRNNFELNQQKQQARKN